MAQVRAAALAVHLGALHEVTVVVLGLDVLRIGGRREARPAAAGVELGLGIEEHVTAAHAAIRAILVVVPVAAGEGALGPLLARDPVLLRRQLLTPLGI